MKRLLPSAAVLLLALAFVLPAAAQPQGTPFPISSVEARAAVQNSLKAIGSFPNDAIESRAKLKQLADHLAKTYSSVPALEEIKRLLFLMVQNLSPSLDLADPDRAPLKQDLSGKLVTFARQPLRGPNPDLKRVQDETWPPDLSHGEKVALQSYSGNTAGAVNQELRTKGHVSPMYALVHERLQSAFRKAKPFHPPVMLSRGLRLEGPGLTGLLDDLNAAKKADKIYVMKGYVSTTVGPNVLGGFDGNVRMHILATHGLDVYPISLYPQEREVLLNHNTTYKVLDVKMDKGKWVINLEQVPPKEDAKEGAAAPPVPGAFATAGRPWAWAAPQLAAAP
jgi:hypothetical protein